LQVAQLRKNEMRNCVCGLTAVIFLALAVCVCRGFPEPAVVQGPGQWTLDVRFKHPEQITVKLPGDARPRRYWYMIVSLTNYTGQDVAFYPKFELMTDRFEIIQAGKGVSGEVFERIKLRYQSQYPFLESLEFAGNRILQGPDNARDIAVIWPDFDPEAKAVKFFLTGLSNETAAIAHPVAKGQNDEPVRVILAKTLELSYAVPGDLAHRAKARMAFKGKRWVMR